MSLESLSDLAAQALEFHRRNGFTAIEVAPLARNVESAIAFGTGGRLGVRFCPALRIEGLVAPSPLIIEPVLTPFGREYTLPEDVMEVRSVYSYEAGSAPSSATIMKSSSSSAILNFPSERDSEEVYFMRGHKIVRPYEGGAVAMDATKEPRVLIDYWQRFAPLDDAGTPPNYIARRHPELYILGVVSAVFDIARINSEAAKNWSQFCSTIDQLNVSQGETAFLGKNPVFVQSTDPLV